MKPIYLDYNATTPIDPEVIEAILPYLRQEFGNPSSSHAFGVRAHAAVETARGQVATLLGAQPSEIVFTGGGTEASNQAIKGTVFAQLQSLWGRWFGKSAHIVISAVEHPATTQPCEFLRRLGCKITVVPVDGDGIVDLYAVARALRTKTALVSIMHSNNEVGTLQPIQEIGKLCKEHGALLHTDAAQSLGKVAVDVNELGVDFLTVAGHKLYAPKGIGVLFVCEGVRVESVIHGASHENGRRAGTENVPYIVGLGKACELAHAKLPDATEHLRQLRDRLWTNLREGLGDRVVANGHAEKRLPNTLNASFLDHIGAELLQKVPEVAASTGSACHEGQVTQSPVLCAMGVPPERGQGALRLTVGRFTTEDEVDAAADALVRAASSCTNRPSSGIQA